MKFLNDITSLASITVGVDDTGHDVQFFGATAGKNLLWDESEDRLIFADNTYLALGTGSDMLQYHTDSHGYIVNQKGNLIIQNTADDGDLIFKSDDGSGGNATYLTLDGGDGTIISSVPFVLATRKLAISSTTDGNHGSGDIVYFGTGSSVVGKIYHYKSDGSWELANANAAANCDGLLAVAIGTDPDVDGMLIRGMVTLIDIQGSEAVGDVLYLSESATGAADCVAPAGNGDIIRIIGYCLTTDDQIWFDPDNTFVEVSA